jgi:hypothetical protein
MECGGGTQSAAALQRVQASDRLRQLAFSTRCRKQESLKSRVVGSGEVEHVGGRERVLREALIQALGPRAHLVDGGAEIKGESAGVGGLTVVEDELAFAPREFEGDP